MDRVPQRALQWWQRQDEASQRRASWLVVCGMVYTFHYLVYCIPQPFFIEDAAISFSYAEHLVAGEGLVTYPGGERVEGYSNALWTFLIAAFRALGLPVWTTAKILGAVFGLLTLPLVLDLTRRMKPAGGQDVTWLAPLCLALTPPFVIWNASGLENSLFCLLLASGTWRLLRESEDARLRPWSAVLFFLLTMTRPEGMMYAAIALLARVMYAVADRRLLPVIAWVAIFIIPWFAYNGWRYWYFAWEFPNTYYAKLGTGKTFRPFGWTIKGWKYIKNYLLLHGVVYALPMLFFALGGLKTAWRRRLSTGLIVLLAPLVLYTGWLPESVTPPDGWTGWMETWGKIRVWSILAAAGLLGLVTLTRPGWRARGVMWAYCASGVFFALYAGGDWMDEWRWFNIVSVSLFPLLAVGLGELLDAVLPDGARTVRLPRRLSRLGEAAPLRVLVMAGLMVPFTINEVYRATVFALYPETSARDIHRRVWYMSWVQERLDLDRVTLLDVDMGAHMFYSGWDIVDIAGLVDVPMARHSDFNKKFITEYIFEERRPHFAHLHDYWEKTSRISKRRGWRRQYIEIEPYPYMGGGLHPGNHIRKDIFVERYESEPAEMIFADRVSLLSHALPSPQVAAGGLVYLSTWWRNARGRGSDVTALVWLDNGAGDRAVTAVKPGYGWYPPSEWSVREKIAGRFWIEVPAELPLGTYRVGMVLIDDESGEILPRITAEPAAVIYAAGEAVFAQTVEVVSDDMAARYAEADRVAALALASEGQCESIWPQWKDATRHRGRDRDWRTAHQGEIETAAAGCWLGRARSTTDRTDRIVQLTEARTWDHRLDGLTDLTVPLAAERDAEGDALAGQEDWEGAYAAYTEALALDPSRSWSRRKAEEARDKRLGIVRPGQEEAP